MGAGSAAVATLCNIDATGVDDNRVTQSVFPQQRHVGAQAPAQVPVVIAGDEEVLIVNQFLVRDGPF